MNVRYFLKHKDLKRRHRESVWKEHLIRKINATISKEWRFRMKDECTIENRGRGVQAKKRKTAHVDHPRKSRRFSSVYRTQERSKKLRQTKDTWIVRVKQKEK